MRESTSRYAVRRPDGHVREAALFDLEAARVDSAAVGRRAHTSWRLSAAAKSQRASSRALHTTDKVRRAQPNAGGRAESVP